MVEVKPAKYSCQSQSDAKSVHILKGKLIDRGFICDIKENDKIPNYDGYIECIDIDGYPKGKIEVQVKTISREYTTPSKSLKLKTLAYVRDCQLPFVLIAVDQIKKIGFWKEITREFAKELIDLAIEKNPKQESISIKLDINQEISKTDLWVKWVDVINNQKHILERWNENQIDLIKAKEQLAQLIDSQKEENTETAPEYIYLNKFIDKLNSLINGRFNVVKNIYRTDFWRYGIAVFDTEEANISYGFFTIDWEENKKQIIRYKIDSMLIGEFAFKYPFFKAYSGINPILSSPDKYAL